MREKMNVFVSRIITGIIALFLLWLVAAGVWSYPWRAVELVAAFCIGMGIYKTVAIGHRKTRGRALLRPVFILSYLCFVAGFAVQLFGVIALVGYSAIIHDQQIFRDWPNLVFSIPFMISVMWGFIFQGDSITQTSRRGIFPKLRLFGSREQREVFRLNW